MQDRDRLARVWPADQLARWEGSISTTADRAADALRRHKYLVLFLFSILYLLATCFRASQKLFWFDEIFTVYMSRLPDMASVWGALKQGADLNPPLFYGLTRFSESLFGEGHIGTRLPEILGFWIFCLCLFRFVSTRTSVLAGFIAMLFPLVTTAYFYAYEARPHGIVLGCGGIALVCWQAAIRSRRRGWCLIALFAALLSAILNHTYGVLLIVPFVLAEIVRSVCLRRVDWCVWLAMVSSSLGVLLSLPLFRAVLKVGSARFSLAKGSMLANSYQFHLGPAVGVLSTGLILYFVFKFAAPYPSSSPNREPSVELPEVAALIALVAMPFFAFLLAKVTGAPLYGRYSISTVAGFGCMFGIMAAKRPPVGLGVLFFLVAQIGVNLFVYAKTITVNEPTGSIALSTSADSFSDQYRAIEAVPNKNSPIALLDDLAFLPIIHYAPANMASRLVYIQDPDIDASNKVHILLGVPGRTESMWDFLSTHDTFITLCTRRSLFKLKYFLEAGADLRMKDISSETFLVYGTFKKNKHESTATPLR
jgi:hypothetical protein